jgi:Holliday junction resolvase RusA-like endonuclease
MNHYWRHVGPRVLISREGRIYRENVRSLLAGIGIEKLSGDLCVRVEVHPPDGRRRDLDNTMKSLLDSLQHGGAYEDDSQIVDLHAIKRPIEPEGKVVVRMKRASERKPKPEPLVIQGSCEACGAREALTVGKWTSARRLNTWPTCGKCGAHLYPVRRNCKTCGAVLRNGNFSTQCTPCETKDRGIGDGDTR